MIVVTEENNTLKTATGQSTTQNTISQDTAKFQRLLTHIQLFINNQPKASDQPQINKMTQINLFEINYRKRERKIDLAPTHTGWR
jgi:hypothetical protein